MSPSDTWWSWYLQHTCPRLRDMAPEQLCELVWAAAVMGRPPHKQWMEVWAAAVVRTLPVTPPDHLARMAWALAALQKVGVLFVHEVFMPEVMQDGLVRTLLHVCVPIVASSRRVRQGRW
jgi:hypothetical protein